ncbi:mCG21893 [Mus musculus]|nr:mCG21893 [Mus musculus]
MLEVRGVHTSQLDLKFNSKSNPQPHGPSPENYPKPLPLPCAVLSSAHDSLL